MATVFWLEVSYLGYVVTYSWHASIIALPNNKISRVETCIGIYVFVILTYGLYILSSAKFFIAQYGHCFRSLDNTARLIWAGENISCNAINF